MKLVIMRGLPASGKTTYAKKLCKEGYRRINRDDIRKMVDDGKYSHENEKLIKSIRNDSIDLSLIMGYNTVIDDTNLSEKVVDSLKEIAKINEAEIEEVFINTPLDICLARDYKREDRVGEGVIRGMYEKYRETFEGMQEIQDGDVGKTGLSVL